MITPHNPNLDRRQFRSPISHIGNFRNTAEIREVCYSSDTVDCVISLPACKNCLLNHSFLVERKAAMKKTVLVGALVASFIAAFPLDQDFLPKDPARKVEVPKQLADTDTTVLNWDQLRSVLAELSLKDRLILELDMTDALRPSELFGLRWRDFSYDECLLLLRQTVYRGKLRNWGKTRKALRPIHIPKELADDLWLWKQESKYSEPDDFIFANRLRKGGFIDPHNYRRKMRKLGEDLGLPKLTFQVIRRTIATLGQKKGTPKDIRGLLRHSRLSTTTDVYMQEIPESVKATVAAINKELRKPKTPEAS
jgi:integrase